jgi:plasmid stabilization system protein ParE
MFDLHDGLVAAANHEAAIRVIDRINATVGFLRVQPYLGRAAEMRDRREMVIDEYVVTYQVKRSSVRILKVEHGARRR